jgi:hypothetical protein
VAAGPPLALAGAPPAPRAAVFDLGRAPVLLPVLALFAALLGLAAHLAARRPESAP